MSGDEPSRPRVGSWQRAQAGLDGGRRGSGSPSLPISPHISPYLHYVQPLLRHKRSRFSANDLCIALDRRGECERCSVRYYDEEGLALLGSAAHAFEAMRLEAEVRL